MSFNILSLGVGDRSCMIMIRTRVLFELISIFGVGLFGDNYEACLRRFSLDICRWALVVRQLSFFRAVLNRHHNSVFVL